MYLLITEELTMHTIDFNDYLNKRMQNDPDFAEGLLKEENKLEKAVANMQTNKTVNNK